MHELRGIVCADFNGDGRKDIATVSPYAGIRLPVPEPGKSHLRITTTLPAWQGGRALAAGDFDGDGKKDLAVAGPSTGLRHYRGNGDGTFQALGDVAAMNAVSSTFPQPYYLMTTFRPTGSSRDELVATHDETNVVWILALGTNGILEVQGTIPSDSVHSMDVGAIHTPLQAASSISLRLNSIAEPSSSFRLEQPHALQLGSQPNNQCAGRAARGESHRPRWRWLE